MSLSLGGRPLTLSLSIMISPSSGTSNPATQRRVVVLPQPEGPRMTTNSPLETSRERPSTAAAPSNFLTRLTRRSSLILLAYIGFGLKTFCNLQSATEAAATYFDGRWTRFFFSIPAAAVHRLPMIILPVCPQNVNASYLLMRYLSSIQGES